MPQVPDYGSFKVEPAGLPDARLGARVSPESLGAGLGETIGRIGVQVAEKERREADDMMVLDADRELGEWETMTLYGEDGALTKQGSQAFELPEEVRNAYIKKIDELNKRFTNDYQRNKFRKLTVPRERGINRTVQRHVASQIQAYEDAATENYIKNARANAAFNYNDPNRIGIEIARQRMAISNWAKINGIPPAEIKGKVETAVSQTHVAVIDRMLNNEEDLRASQYFKENKDEITGDHIAGVEKALADGRLRGESQRKSDAIIESTDDYSKQLERARKINDPKVRDAVTERISQRNAQKERAAQQVQQKAKDNAWSMVAQGINSSDEIPLTIWSKLDGRDQTTIIDYLKKKASTEEIETKWDVYNRLFTMAPEELLKEDLNNYRMDLNDTNFQQIHTLWRSYRDAAASGDDALILDSATLQQQITASIKHMDLSQKEEGQMREVIYKHLNAEQQRLGKKLNQDERKAIIDDLLIEGRTRGTLFGFDRLWPDAKHRFFEIEDEEGRKRFYVEDIPPRRRRQMADALRRRGMTVTDENLMWLYNAYLLGTYEIE